MACGIQVAQAHGSTLDPVWTLAAWEQAEFMVQQLAHSDAPFSFLGSPTYHISYRSYDGQGMMDKESPSPVLSQESWLVSEQGEGSEPEPGSLSPRRDKVIMLHSGGSMLALQGLVQRFPNLF